MVSVNCFLIKVALLVGTYNMKTNGFVINLNKEDTLKLSPEAFSEDQTFHQTSVRHYARHGLCRTTEGQTYLYEAMKSKLCDTKLPFIKDFIIELCREKTHMLDRWVAELFDIDGDGFISHFEKNFYINDE